LNPHKRTISLRDQAKDHSGRAGLACYRLDTYAQKETLNDHKMQYFIAFRDLSDGLDVPHNIEQK